MKTKAISSALLIASLTAWGQTNPAITSWLQNTTIKGRHWVAGNSTVIVDQNNIANVQSVKYSATSVYISTQGIPTYPTGPFQDGNPSQATPNTNPLFKFPLNPAQNTGTATSTTAGTIGVFINGVAL